jgi:ferrous iron transport protein B
MKLFNIRGKKKKNCSRGKKNNTSQSLKKIAIVGNPNVGKSLMFNRLTGGYVTVSNYPGTTVEIFRGKGIIGDEEFEIIDTPGMYSLLPVTEEEAVARNILITENPEIVLHIIDAKNIERMLSFTFQLIEAGLWVLLVLNMMDEVEMLGKKIRIENLETQLHIPVVSTISTTGKGMNVLKRRIENYVREEI